MFEIDLPRRSWINAFPEVDSSEFDYTWIGQFKAGELNGECKVYLLGQLEYDGEMKDGKYDGYGRKYYNGSNAIEYEGYYKKDMRHGKGTSYYEDGTVIYSGEWKNDDYA